MKITLDKEYDVVYNLKSLIYIEENAGVNMFSANVQEQMNNLSVDQRIELIAAGLLHTGLTKEDVVEKLDLKNLVSTILQCGEALAQAMNPGAKKKKA